MTTDLEAIRERHERDVGTWIDTTDPVAPTWAHQLFRDRAALISTNRELVKLLADVKTAVELVEVDLEAGNILAKTRVKLAASRVRATIRALSPTQPKSGEVG